MACAQVPGAHWRHNFLLAEPECPCVREGGRCHAPGVCLHGCAQAADDLTRLGQEMEAPKCYHPDDWPGECPCLPSCGCCKATPALPPRRPPYAVAYDLQDGTQYEVALPGDATVCALDGALIITHASSPVKGLTQVQPFMNTEQ